MHRLTDPNSLMHSLLTTKRLQCPLSCRHRASCSRRCHCCCHQRQALQ
jgi:hypothetical protein